MLLGGLQKTSLIDFPGRVACTVFVVGCNFRCPFCHNRDLVSLKEFRKSKLELLKEEDFFRFLEKRKGILDGVCITGGEPTLQKDLLGFCQRIKDLGFKVKLDTNGSQPEVLKKLMKKGVVDFIAMDVKTNFSAYDKAAGVKVQAEKVKRSIKLILKSGLEYELRTTIVPGVHDQVGLVRLAKELKKLDNELVWIWQQFRAKNCLDPVYLKKKPYKEEKMRGFLREVKGLLPKITIRGMDK